MPFHEQDPLNPGNTLDGWICKADGPMFGSILINKLNGDILETPQTIYGVPNMVRPYQSPLILSALMYLSLS